MVGVLAGLALGCGLRDLVPLAYPASWHFFLARALLGNAGLLALFEVAGALTPRQPLALYAALRFLKCAAPPNHSTRTPCSTAPPAPLSDRVLVRRYMMVPTYILLLAPHMFMRLGL